jgi:AraC family transcriptional regulator of arabinose operon
MPELRPSSTTAIDHRLLRILDAIAQDSTQDVRALAELVNLSPSRLQHLFRGQLGMAIRDAISEQKLARAARLLISTDQRIKEITFEVGYEHASSFVRAFRKQYGTTPENYRRCQGQISPATTASAGANIDCAQAATHGAGVTGL